MTFMYENPPENMAAFTFDQKRVAGSRQPKGNDLCDGSQTMQQADCKMNGGQVFHVGKRNSCMVGLVNGIAFSAVVWMGIALLI